MGYHKKKSSHLLQGNISTWVNAFFLFLVVLFSACEKSEYIDRTKDIIANIEEKDLEYPYRIVTTTGFTYDIVSHIVGDYAEVTQIIPAGVDPHTYVPTRSDIVDIYFADIVIYSGIHLEGSLYNVFQRIGDKRTLYAIGDIVESPFVTQEEEADPHIWMDAELWMEGTQGVADILSLIDPVNAGVYHTNAKTYIAELQEMNETILALYNTIPKEKRILITSHDAFNYFGQAYGFDVYGIQGISTINESSLKHISNLIEIVIQKGVAAVFVESTVSPKYIHALMEGAASRGAHLKEGGKLYADSLGIAGSDEDNYIGMMLYNARVITHALGGDVSLLTQESYTQGDTNE